MPHGSHTGNKMARAGKRDSPDRRDAASNAPPVPAQVAKDDGHVWRGDDKDALLD